MSILSSPDVLQVCQIVFVAKYSADSAHISDARRRKSRPLRPAGLISFCYGTGASLGGQID